MKLIKNNCLNLQKFKRDFYINLYNEIHHCLLTLTIPHSSPTYIFVQLKVLDGKNDRLYQFDGILPEIATNREVIRFFICILFKTPDICPEPALLLLVSP